MIEINREYIVEKVIENLKEKSSDYIEHVDCAITRFHIHRLLAEGFQLEDFISVIDKKYQQWKGTRFEQFLRPQTLFGNKFKIYLNERVIPRISSFEKLSRAVEETKLAFRGLDKNNRTT